MEVMQCNTEVAMETIGEARNLKAKIQMTESRFTSSRPTETKCKKNKSLLNKHKRG